MQSDLKPYYRDDLVTLYLGDCRSLLPSLEQVDLLVTDPPYPVITGGDSDGANSRRPTGTLKLNRKIFTHQNDISFDEWLPYAFKALKDDSHAYVFTNLLNLVKINSSALQSGFKVHNLLVWQKNTNTPSQFYMKNCEYIWFLRKGKAKWINNIGASKTVHFAKSVPSKQRIHPTQKPVELLEMYIENSSTVGQTVLDPFAGSGSTLIAARNLGRKSIGIERDERFAELTALALSQGAEQMAA